MALTFEEEKALCELKQNHKVEFEILRHGNVMEEKKMDVELARICGEEREDVGNVEER